MALGLLLGGPQHLEPHELEALVLEAGDDGGDEATLHAVGLDGDKGAFLRWKGDRCHSEKHIQAKVEGHKKGIQGITHN